MYELSSLLDECACQTKEEEIDELIRIAKKNQNDRKRFIKLIPHVLKKLASKKNKIIFEKKLADIYALQSDFPEEFAKIQEEIEDVQKQAKVRFTT